MRKTVLSLVAAAVAVAAFTPTLANARGWHHHHHHYHHHWRHHHHDM